MYVSKYLLGNILRRTLPGIGRIKESKVKKRWDQIKLPSELPQDYRDSDSDCYDGRQIPLRRSETIRSASSQTSASTVLSSKFGFSFFFFFWLFGLPNLSHSNDRPLSSSVFVCTTGQSFNAHALYLYVAHVFTYIP